MTKEVEVMLEMECVPNGVIVDVGRIHLRMYWEAVAHVRAPGGPGEFERQRG
jgi:hypothetical protein